MTWNILYLDSVESWLDRLPTQQMKSVAKELRLLELTGNQLKLPHSRSLGQGLFELKERKFGYRIYYAFDQGSVIVLLHAGDKTSQERHIRVARDLLVKYRNDENESKKF